LEGATKMNLGNTQQTQLIQQVRKRT